MCKYVLLSNAAQQLFYSIYETETKILYNEITPEDLSAVNKKLNRLYRQHANTRREVKKIENKFCELLPIETVLYYIVSQQKFILK
jgi:hypothetical protein